MGACTFTPGVQAVFGRPDELFDGTYDVFKNKRVVRGMLALSTTYATGGDSVNPAIFGLRRVDRILVDAGGLGQTAGVASTGSGGSGLSVQLVGTREAPLLQAFETNLGEVGVGTNQSTRPFPVWVIGEG